MRGNTKSASGAGVVGSESTEFVLKYNPYQQAFLNARRKRLGDGTRAFDRMCVIAGRRGGKTLIGAISAVEEASVPNSIGWCIAPTYGDLWDYVIPAVMKVLPQAWIKPGKGPDGGWSAAFQRLTLKNGSQIAFRSAEDPQRMRGAGLNWAWIDEGCKINKLVWTTLEPALVDRRGCAWVTTTPNQYDWVYHKFWKRATNQKHLMRGYWGVKYRTIDNPTISQEEIDRQRATHDDLWFKQEYEAEFVSFTGAIYGDRVESCLLQSDDEVRQRFLPEWPHIPRELPCVVGLDPGADHPFAGVRMVVTHGGLLVIDEYRKRLAAYADHAVTFNRWKTEHHEISFAIDKTANQGQIELAQHGILTSAAENNQILGIQRVQSWMKTGRLGIVVDRCPMLVDELRAYRYKDTTNDQGETGREQAFKEDDDLCDALRYGVMLWPELPDTPAVLLGRDPRSVPEQARWAWERERRINAKTDDDATNWGTDLDPAGDMWITEESASVW
jgi:hypothetical protein